MTLDPQTKMARTLRGPESARRVGRPRCYVAMGDSFTAGADCPKGRRWPDLLADHLWRARDDVHYSNLAVNGATSASVLSQVPAALELEPDLVSIVCGGNDALLSLRPDVDAYRSNLRQIMLRLRATLPGAVLVTATCPSAWSFLGLRPKTRARVEGAAAELNRATRSLAETYGAICVDLADHPGLEDPENFSDDGLHPSLLGHLRMADEVIRQLWPREVAA